MKSSIYIAAVLVIFTLVGAKGQGNSTMSVEYSMGFGSGDLKSYVSSPSFRGFTVEYKNYIKPNLSIGGETGWNVFYDHKSSDTYSLGTVSLTGVQYRYVNSVPILMTCNYHFKPDAKLNPFVGLGLGTLFISQKTNSGLWSATTEDWHLGIKPEVGALWAVNPNLTLLISGKYYYGVATKDVSALSYFTLNIGFVFRGR